MSYDGYYVSYDGYCVMALHFKV